MKSLLHTLQDNESILLMYLFDELPADDRAEVEAMLASDGALRRELNEISAQYQHASGSIERADLTARHGTRNVKAQAARAIDQWNTQRMLAIPPEPVYRRSLRWLVYSSGLAAAIALCFVCFWVMRAEPESRQIVLAIVPEISDHERDIIDSFDSKPAADEQSTVALADSQSLEGSDLLRKSLDPSEDIVNDTLKHVDLNAAEMQINALAQLSDPESIDSGSAFQ